VYFCPALCIRVHGCRAPSFGEINEECVREQFSRGLECNPAMITTHLRMHAGFSFGHCCALAFSICDLFIVMSEVQRQMLRKYMLAPSNASHACVGCVHLSFNLKGNPHTDLAALCHCALPVAWPQRCTGHFFSIPLLQQPSARGNALLRLFSSLTCTRARALPTAL
jgi:hypothetical protein